jgi:glycosyltransferase involved in cell wall biosynthesis
MTIGQRTVRRVAVVPAFNEAPTVAKVLDQVYDFVDELVVVDDGSTDATLFEIETWLPGHEQARLLIHERNRGMSDAFYTAFTDLRRRVQQGNLDVDDFVYTIDADGQHELGVLDDLHQIMIDEGLDALIVRRDLSNYPLYKRLGNSAMSAWASMWAGSRLPDVESGYRIFRAGALVNALDYYHGYQYSETVEVAVVLKRLGYRMRADIVVPVPIYRSRTRMRDAAIDLVMIPAAAWRSTRPLGLIGRLRALAVPAMVSATPLVLAITLRRRLR